MGQEGRSGTTSDLSDTNLLKKKSSSTAFQPLRKVVLDELADTPLCPQIPQVSDHANSSHQTNSSTHQINVKTQTRSGFDCNLDTDIGSDKGSISHAQPSSSHQPTASSSSSNQHTSPSISDKDKRVKKKHKWILMMIMILSTFLKQSKKNDIWRFIGNLLHATSFPLTWSGGQTSNSSLRIPSMSTLT